jgi:CheY-like chemotaxis protein
MAALKLLVVEDDAASLDLMAELLQRFKAEVRPISDSQAAPDLIQREKFDGIFLDLKMPILSGFELAKLVRESACNKATPLVIVTGRDEQDTMHLSFFTRSHLLPAKAHRYAETGPTIGKDPEPVI